MENGLFFSFLEQCEQQQQQQSRRAHLKVGRLLSVAGRC
jgi:hypothetical protein